MSHRTILIPTGSASAELPSSRPFGRRAFGRLAGATGLGVALGTDTLVRPAAAGTRTFTTTGTAVPALAAFDDTSKQFMRDRSIPAGQFAVTYQGRLVLARGYTWTDDPTLTVQPVSLFRLASMTKPITAAAIMTLVQARKLNLDKPITALLRLTPPPGQVPDP